MSPFPLARRAAVALLLAACAGTAACSTGLSSADSPALNQVVNLGLTSQEGAPVAVPIAGSRATVLHFWAPECPSCRATIPALLQRRRELEAAGAGILLVCVLGAGDSPDDARAALSIWGIEEDFVLDRQGAAMAQIGARATPAVAIIDARGALSWLAPDGITPSDVVKALPAP
jgi:thiol-disulfide isomerase/thioredoxin